MAVAHSEPLISTAACQKFDLDLWPWSMTLTLIYDLDLKGMSQSCINTNLGIWPWPLTYNLDLQSQPSQGQGRPPCQISRSKVKRFSRESVDWRTDWRTEGQTDRQTDWRTLPILSSPCFAKATRSIIMFVLQSWIFGGRGGGGCYKLTCGMDSQKLALINVNGQIKFFWTGRSARVYWTTSNCIFFIRSIFLHLAS